MRPLRLAMVAVSIALAQGGAAAERPPMAPAAAPGIGEVVASVALELPPGESPVALQERVAIQTGAPLSRRDVQRTVVALFGTGRFADVVVTAEPAREAGQVEVRIRCLPRQVIERIRIVDRATSPAIDEERIRRAVGLATGDELWPERLDQAADRVQKLFTRSGYRGAEVRARRDEGRQADLEFLIDEGPPTRVAEIQLSGVIDPSRFTEGWSTVVGGVLDMDLLEADVRALRTRLRREGYLRARIGAPIVSAEGARAHVRIPVEAGPRVIFRFQGATIFSSAELQAQLRLGEDQVLDGPAIQAAAGRVRAFYVANGYAEARASASELALGANEMIIVVRIDEGRRYRVRQVLFPKAVGRSAAWLRARLDEALDELSPREQRGIAAESERLARALGSTPAVLSRATAEPREVWNPPIWDQAVVRLVDHYHADGFLDATSEGTRTTMDERTGIVDVEIRIREGVRTRVGAITFDGARHLSEAELTRALRIAVGDPLAGSEVEASRAALLALYGRQGFAYVQVVESEELSPDHARATVRFRIDEGPQVKVRRVVVRGTRRTREDVVLRSLTLHPGDVYTPALAASSQAGLLRLGVFRSVGLRLSDPDLPEEEKDLQIEAAERPYQSLAQSVGFSLANGPRAMIEFIRPNLFGRALELTARAKVNYPIPALRSDEASLSRKEPLDRIEGHGELGLHDPLLSFFGFGSGAQMTAVIERLHRPAYDLSRVSGLFSLGVPLTIPISLALQYELEVDHIVKSEAAETLTLADVERLRFPDGVTTLQSFRPILSMDFRDNPVHPRSGWMATSTVEYTHSIDSSTFFGLLNASDNYANMLKLSAAVTGYLPVSRQSVLALSLRGGRVVPFGDSTTIPPRRFFMGGASSMRGYGEDEMVPEDVRKPYLEEIRACATSLSGTACSSVAKELASGQTLISEGGQAFVLGKFELRFPIFQGVEGGLFTDIGNLWLDPSLLSLTDLHVNLGAGLRLITPIGPAVLDVGFNPGADGRLGESVVAPHFSIGLF